MSLPRAPESKEMRKEIAVSDPTSYSSIEKARGLPAGGQQYAMLMAKIEGTNPDVTIKTLVWDDNYGWLELVEGGFSNATESFAAPVFVGEQIFFPHITINGGTSVKVSIRVNGFKARIEAD